MARSCEQIGSAYGPDAHACTLQFKGEITRGDALLIQEAISSSPYIVELASFYSPGGDPFEALRISDVLNKNFVAFDTASCLNGLACTARNKGKLCASACALAYLASNERYGTEIYLHRPTFPARRFAGLAGPEAQLAYQAAVDKLIAELRTRHVSDEQIQLMMSIPSQGVVKLQTGYPSKSPWMEEWLAAKCGADFSPDGLVSNGMLCKGDVVMLEQARIQHKGWNGVVPKSMADMRGGAAVALH